MAIFSFLKSTILSKWVMAVTGCILVLFLCGHTCGNMLLYFGKEAYNTYAAFLQGLGEILWIVRIVLIICVVLHIITAVRLKLLNRTGRPTKYHVKKYLKAKLTSRTMIWTGLMLLCLFLYHLLHFTVGVTNPDDYNVDETLVIRNTELVQEVDARLASQIPAEVKTVVDGKKLYVSSDIVKTAKTRHDVYKMVVLGFRNPIIALCYCIFVILVGFHLNHGIQSMLQTAGFNHPRYTPAVIKCCTALSVLIVLCLISLPITIVTGLVGGTI